MSIVVLDTETTGINSNIDRIVEVAIMEWPSDDPEILWSENFFPYLWMINPGMPIPLEVSMIHGITDAHVAEQPSFDAFAMQIAEIIKGASVIIGHNPFFDRGMLNAEFRRLNMIISFPPLVCTKRLWDIHEPREERHLQNAFKRFVSRNGFENAHSAMADVKACRDILCGQIKEFGLQGPLHDLDPDAKLFWGPSSHVIWSNGVLHINFGKHKGTPCHIIERSYYEWIARTMDFPEHLKILADYMRGIAPKDLTAEVLASWAYGKVG